MAAEGADKASAEAPLLRAVDEVLAAKCTCSSSSDCTCKKGTCKCSKCQRPRHDMVKTLRRAAETPELQNARYDASAGVFI